MNTPESGASVCYWCGEAVADPSKNRDHVFPRGLFLPPRPSDLVTVPACARHNGSFSLDEEYFRDFVLASCFRHPEAKQLWEEKTRSTLSKKPSYRVMLAAQIRKLQVSTAGGIFLGQMDALIADKKRIDNVLRKMVRGLYLHHYDEPLGPITLSTDQVRADRPLPGKALSLVQSLPIRRIGHVMYRFSRPEDEPGAAALALALFDRLMLVALAVPSQVDDRNDLPMARRKSGRGIWLARP